MSLLWDINLAHELSDIENAEKAENKHTKDTANKRIKLFYYYKIFFIQKWMVIIFYKIINSLVELRFIIHNEFRIIF